MKLNLELLKKFIELPSGEVSSLRPLFDDLGLEVDGVEDQNGHSILNIETLAQRGDHLSAWGVARELSARLMCNVKQPKLGALPAGEPAKVQLKVETDKCYHYALLDVQFSPDFPLDREVSRYLANVPEDRPALVSYLNYVQLEFGQPMHAFDYDKVEGEIRVVLSSAEEECIGLDGKTYKIPAGSLLIVDRKKTIAVAGVIGCANSMVDLNTKRALIESAAFDPICVRKTARRMGLSTDASYIFERGSDPENCEIALRRLLALVEAASSVNDSWVHPLGFSSVQESRLADREIQVDLAFLRQQLALPRIKAVEVSSRLKHLGYLSLVSDENSIRVKVPSWRMWNCESASTIIEDFARSYGLNSIPLSLPQSELFPPARSGMQDFIESSEPVLNALGFTEVVTRSYYSAQFVDWLESLAPGVESKHVKIANALDSAYSHLRMTAMLHLAQLAERSHRQGLTSVKVYELSRVFSKDKPKFSPYDHETTVLSIGFSGRWFDNQWKKEPDLKESLAHLRGVVDALGAANRRELSLRASSYPFFHPSCQAEIVCEGELVGRLGVIHPALRDRLELGHEFFFAELYVDSLIQTARLETSRTINNFPSIRRDLTLKVQLRQFAEEVVGQLNSLNIPNLTEVVVADDFQKSGEDFRRTTFKLLFQAQDRTLQSVEVDQAMQQVIQDLSARYQIELAI